MESLFDFELEDISGKKVSLNQFAGKVVLVVNTATECGFAGQFSELQSLYDSFKEQGFYILGFPSNDFGNQEPLSSAEISTYCEVNFGVNFPIFAKSRVRGPYANDLFKYLSDKKRNGKFSSVPRWNFQKYLFDREGHIIDFYYPITKPNSSRLKKAIQKLLV